MAAPWLRASVAASASIKWQARSIARRVDSLYPCSGRALLLAAGAPSVGKVERADDLCKVSRLHRQEAADERFVYVDLDLFSCIPIVARAFFLPSAQGVGLAPP